MQHTEPQTSTAHNQENLIPLSILITRDLIFTSKITGTACQLGHKILVARHNPDVITMIDHWKPRVLFLDLMAADLTASTQIQLYRKHCGPAATFVAFGPHVDRDSLARAKSSGCNIVISRNELIAQLSELILRLLSGTITANKPT